jgi:arginyl-tRNA synthetase
MKQELIKNIENVLKEKGVENPKVVLDYPTHFKFGDFTTNVALSYAKELKSKPLDLALEIKEELTKKGQKHIIRIDVIEPGFINFFFDGHYFNKVIKEILEEKENFGKSEHAKGYKVMVEYTDPNPFKEFHIGHLMPNVIGESVSRIIEANGAEVKRVNYQGDVGLHVAKAVWAIIKGKDLWSAYAYGHKEFEENENIKKEIIEINKKIYNKSDEPINEIYEEGKQKSLSYFEVMYEKLGTRFDMYFFESEVAGFGKDIVEENIDKVFEKSDGAIVFKGENFDKKLHTRVFVSKDGLPTYEAKELGLSKIKYDSYPYDLSVIVTGNEINEYFKVLLKAMSLVFPELAQKTKHLSHGMLRLPTGKMSSRTGNIISAESLINQVKERIKDKIEDDSIAELIAIGAIKYSTLRQAIGGDIIFDFDKSISFEGDSGPYLQYSTVRANSLLKKAEKELDYSIPENWQTTDLEKLLERFPGVIEKAGMEYAPHHIATYLIDLAGEFNSFYAGEKITDSPYRLALTQSFNVVMTTGLSLLGIKVPERM